MPNIWSKQAYVQGFDFESITFKKSVNMFERMEISESIYKGVLEPSYKKHIREDSNRAGHSRQNRVELAFSWTLPKNGESNGKRRKRHVDRSTRNPKPVSSMVPDILQKNLRSWDSAELSTLIVGLLRTAGSAPYPGKI